MTKVHDATLEIATQIIIDIGSLVERLKKLPMGSIKDTRFLPEDASDGGYELDGYYALKNISWHIDLLAQAVNDFCDARRKK